MLNNISLADGYTEDGYLAEVPGIYGALRFKYRPMLLEERDAIEGQQSRIDALKYAKLCITNVTERVKQWDNTDAKGDVLPINFDNVRTLRPYLMDRLYLVIAGKVPSDPDPNAQPASDDAVELEAVLSGKSVSQAKAEADAKN